MLWRWDFQLHPSRMARCLASFSARHADALRNAVWSDCRHGLRLLSEPCAVPAEDTAGTFAAHRRLCVIKHCIHLVRADWSGRDVCRWIVVQPVWGAFATQAGHRRIDVAVRAVRSERGERRPAPAYDFSEIDSLMQTALAAKTTAGRRGGDRQRRPCCVSQGVRQIDRIDPAIEPLTEDHHLRHGVPVEMYLYLRRHHADV